MKNEMKKGRRQGMTLMEIVIVIAIIAVLGLVAAPKFMEMTESARVAAFQQNFNAAKSAYTMMQAKEGGRYADDLGDLATYLADLPDDADEDDVRALLRKPFRSKADTDCTVAIDDGTLTMMVTGLEGTYDEDDYPATVTGDVTTLTFTYRP